MILKKDITGISCLLIEEGLDELTFLHKSILDFFAASYVKKFNETNSKSFYSDKNLKHQKWIPVLYFLKTIDTYKYAKFYAIEKFKNQLSLLESIIKNRDFSSKISEILIDFYGKLNFVYKLDETKDKYYIAYLETNNVVGLETSNFDQDFANFVFAEFLMEIEPRDVMRQQIEKINEIDGSLAYSIKIDYLIESNWIEKIINFAQTCKEKIMIIIRNYEEAVLKEESKEELFFIE